MHKFVGKWQLTSSTNFDEYMKELGVGMIMRKFANNNKPLQEFVVSGDWTTIRTISPLRTTEIMFKINEEFDEVTGDDKTIKSIVRQESETKYVQVQYRDAESSITRELIGDQYIMTLSYNNVEAIRVYERAE